MTPATAPIGQTTREEYDAIGGETVNWSRLKYLVEGSPKHFRHFAENPPPETDVMLLGRATHTAVFEPDRLLLEYVVWEGGRRFGKEWDAFCAANSSKTILTVQEYETACAIRDAVRAHPAAAALLAAGTPECTMTWQDKDTGLPCKCRMDWLSETALVDLKTTRSVELRRFGRHAADYLVHCQLAFYQMGLWTRRLERQTFVIAVESKPPHDLAVYEFTDDDLYAGEVKVRAALALLKTCRERDQWPGQYPEPLRVLLPGWEWPNPDEEDAVMRGGDDEPA